MLVLCVARLFPDKMHHFVGDPVHGPAYTPQPEIQSCRLGFSINDQSQGSGGHCLIQVVRELAGKSKIITTRPAKSGI